MRYDTYVVSDIMDGGTITISCADGQRIKVVTATYSPAVGEPVDVKEMLQKSLASNDSSNYTLRANTIGQSVGGTLTFRYRCVTPVAAY